jgi:hypothetical protein
MATGHLRHFIEHYLAPHPAQAVKELFISTAILDFAVSAVMIFEPIYLHAQGFSIQQILLFYIAVYVLYFFLLPIGGRICRRHGYEHTILFSSPFLILYYLSFFAISYNRVFVAAAVVALVIQKILYWPGYHSNFATWSEKTERGREISNLSALVAFTSAMAPVIGGLVVAIWGFKMLFVIVAILILVSNIPMLRTPELFMPKPFPYLEAFKRLVKRENFRPLLVFIGYGEELIALVLWPLFIANLIPDLFSLGIVISLSMLANILATLYIGTIVDDGGRLPVLRSGTVFVAGSWLARIMVGNGLGIFLIDSFYRVAKNMVGVPLMAIVYDGARLTGAAEAVVFFEMALSLGKIAAALIAMAIFHFFPGFWTGIFVLACAFSALFLFMRDQTKKPVI